MRGHVATKDERGMEEHSSFVGIWLVREND